MVAAPCGREGVRGRPLATLVLWGTRGGDDDDERGITPLVLRICSLADVTCLCIGLPGSAFSPIAVTRDGPEREGGASAAAGLESAHFC